MTNQILESKLDRSINIISSTDRGSFETRAVYRDNTLIIYLSSATGCNLSCRMCHLTQLGLTKTEYAQVTDYLECTTRLFGHLNNHNGFEGVDSLHFNFMARGDALSNPFFINRVEDILGHLTSIAKLYLKGVKPKFKISTIFPKDHAISASALPIWVRDTVLDWNEIDTEFYYSLYSLSSLFRKKWLPKATDPDYVGSIFQGMDKGLRLHHALIKGQNDREEDIALIHQWLKQHDLRVKLNIVRYNPFDSACGEEADEMSTIEYVRQMKLSNRILDTQIVSRADPAVAAACGMFIA